MLLRATVHGRRYQFPDLRVLMGKANEEKSGDVLARVAADYPRTWTDDLLDDITLCRRIVEQRGQAMLVLDQTHPDNGLPVVKVFVPGLRHFWSLLGPGRLYDVPDQLGWLPRPLAEHELNPVPVSA